ITILLAPRMGILPRLGLTAAAYLAAAAILPLTRRNPLRTPLAAWGMVVAHFGIAVALAGMAANAAFTSERLAVARPGDRLGVGPWPRWPRCGQPRRQAGRRPVARPAAGGHSDGGQELDGDEAGAARNTRPGTGDAEAA